MAIERSERSRNPMNRRACTLIGESRVKYRARSFFIYDKEQSAPIVGTSGKIWFLRRVCSLVQPRKGAIVLPREEDRSVSHAMLSKLRKLSSRKIRHLSAIAE